jgi:kynureninase
LSCENPANLEIKTLKIHPSWRRMDDWQNTASASSSLIQSYLPGWHRWDACRGVAERNWRSHQVGAADRGWNENWFDAPCRIGEKIAQLVGAAEGQVIVSDSTSINLYKLAMGALGKNPVRTKVVTDELNFPSDLYVLQSCIAQLGNRHRLHVVRSRDGISIDPAYIAAAIDGETALVSLSHVAFKSGFMYSGREITRLAHQAGALMLWDLCHSVGAVPVDLDAWGADLAVGCTYKYLNDGPGSPAFLYVRKALQDELFHPSAGGSASINPLPSSLTYPCAGAHFW